MLNSENIESLFGQLRKKITLESDQMDLIKKITSLSDEITKLKTEKEYLETSVKIAESLLEFYGYSFSKTERFDTLNLVKDCDRELKELAKQIMIKADRLDKYTLMLDYLSYPTIKKIAEVRMKNK